MAVRKIIGVMLVLTSGLGSGIAVWISLRRSAETLEGLIRAVRYMRTQICIRKISLYALTEELEREFPALFPGASDLQKKMTEGPFHAVWKDYLDCRPFPREAAMALAELGTELSRGDEPDGAFDRCTKKMEALLAEKREVEKKNGRLCAGLGFSLGAVTAILLL